MIPLLSLGLAAALEIDCIKNPTNESCIDFKLGGKHIENDLNDLCDGSRMPACSIKKSCLLPSYQSKPYCNGFSLLADICGNDMPKMKKCNTYTSMCTKDSVIKQCKDYPGIEGLPTTRDARSYVQDICQEMDMKECQSDSSQNWLDQYANLCIAMPGMSQCKAFNKLCSRDSTLPFCESQPSQGPTMKMYFHFGYRDYVLFESWVPSTAFQYFLACLFCIGVGIGYEYLLYMNCLLESSWRNSSQGSIDLSQTINIPLSQDPSPSHSNSSHPILQEEEGLIAFSDQSRFRNLSAMQIRLIRAGMRFVTVSGAYICMLLVMSFNIGLFVSVVLGLSIGSFLWNGADLLPRSLVEKEHCC